MLHGRLIELVAALGFEAFEIGKMRDGPFQRHSRGSVFELASDRGDHLVPFADGFSELAKVAMERRQIGPPALWIGLDVAGLLDRRQAKQAPLVSLARG